MPNIIRSGVSGIDNILYGGLPKGSSIIVEGSPGTGKTTLGVQYLYHGAVDHGEAGIYITFEEFPQQIYEDMQAFGWDLRGLEKQNLLRVISIKPETLLKQMKTPDGIFEQMIREINCQRIVVDSISLLQYLHDHPADNREALYSLRNIFRKHSLTALLLSEQTQLQSGRASFEHYVADGVIRLSLTEQMMKYRKRTLEITKMRGRKVVTGEHIYRITEQGIHLVPALSMVEDVSITSDDMLPTGIKALDRILFGGIPKGSSIIFDTNSKASYKFIVSSIVTEQILQGNRIIALLSGLNSVSDLEKMYTLYGVDLREACERGAAYFLEHYAREVPKGFEQAVHMIKDISNEQFLNYIRQHLTPKFIESMNRKENWFMYYDLNTLHSQRGAEFARRIFAEDLVKARSAGITTFALCNFAEIGNETASYLERSANTVIRTWVDGNYQYLQVTKSASGKVSEPQIVETIPDKPYIRLV